MKLGHGVERIENAFERARAEQRAALLAFITLGYPSPDESVDLIAGIAAAGADIVELGVPFSDPLADGPIIQQASQEALRQGMTVERCFEVVENLRQNGISTPFILMGYYNPILAFGPDSFCARCHSLMVDGLIVPDLPPEESGELETACRRWGVALIYLLAPTSTAERIELVAGRSQGFIYLVSSLGTTGPRGELAPDLQDIVRRVRRSTGKPLAVGFGISHADQVSQLAAFADGVIVGSALVDRAGRDDGGLDLFSFVRDLKDATRKEPAKAR